MKDIVYVNNNVLGYFEGDTYISYSKDEKEKLFIDLENKIKKADYRRKITSLIVGIVLYVAFFFFVGLTFSNTIDLGENKIVNLTFALAVAVATWVLFYYILGLFLYKKIHINYYFKSKKTSNPNSALMYASSNYYKYVNQYSSYLKQANFSEVNNPKKLVSFGLTKISKFKNIIFNGKISSNVPYFYISYKNKRLLFLPGMVILVDGKNSKVIEPTNFKVSKQNKTYHLYNDDKLIISMDELVDFNINFFYFKYEQL